MSRYTSRVVPYPTQGTLSSGRTTGAYSRALPYARAAYSLVKAAAPIVRYGYSRYRNYVNTRQGVRRATRSYQTNRGRDMSGYTNKPSLPKKVAKISKKVTNLQKEMKSQRSELIYHDRSTGRCLSTVNTCNHVMSSDMQINDLEAVLAQLRFFDSATPGTLVQADGASGTYNRDYHFKNIYSTTTVHNNYQVPAQVTVYVVCVKDDSSIAPLTAYTNGLADVGNPSSTSPMIHLTDSPQFNELWKICKTKKILLAPGQRASVSYSVKDIYYNPSITDSQTSSYQRKYKSYAFLIRVEGVYGHDTTNNEQGQLAAGVDYNTHFKYVVHYDAGGDLKYIYVGDSSSTFTNGGLVSSKPVADNIGYSVS